MLRREQKWWQVQYLGAFVALGVSNVAMAEELAALTETDQECVHCIGVMRRAKEGDRVYPALQSLRALRKVGGLVPLHARDTERPVAE